MPTDEENVQYLYLVLTSSGPPQIDWSEIGKALELKTGAVSKRWSRLKTALNDGKNPGPTAYQFLWLCVKHSTRDKAPDWNEIAAKSNTTPGAASKRYSRMKQAFESGAEAPTSAAAKGAGDDPSSPAKASPAKRKRATPKKKAATKVENVEDDMEDIKTEEQGAFPKKKQRTPAKPRARATPKPKATPKSKAKNQAKVKDEEEAESSIVPETEATTIIITKSEGEVEGDDYYGSQGYMGGGEVGDVDEETAQDRVNEWLKEAYV